MGAECTACGTLNADGLKFCGECGARLVAAVAGHETRRTVTILFADVSGSTSLGEQLDPESLRALMGRYFAQMRAVIEGHGGTVEKFIGDAVMAVFGIPQLHEDDALRAVRAAADIRERLTVLNAQLQADRGIAILFRTGVNTGEVVAGDPATGETLVTGDAVNTAARLEQAAAPGEVVLGPATYHLVRDAVQVEQLEPLTLKGKAEPLRAYRLISVTPGAAGRTRRQDAPLIGREAEMARLQQAFANAVAERHCELFTLLAPPGIGKSRLVAEFVTSVGSQGQVLTGRCLPYGEGITYWPLAEALKRAAGIDEGDDRETALARLREFAREAVQADVVTARVGQAVGLDEGSAPPEDVFWAVRKLLESRARALPLVIVFDDIQWADDAFLDLLEHLAQLVHDAPVLLVCPARPELLERRPAWAIGMPQAAVLLLEPLPADSAGQLIDQLPGGMAVPDAMRRRILDAAEGNPLFVEEMLGMLVDEGALTLRDGEWQAAADLASMSVPPTVTALLAARLDRLEPNERGMAERASVIGRSFEQAALSEMLTPVERGGMVRSLLGLVRKDLIRPDHSEVSAGDAFRFRHVLIRDAAYELLPKAERAELHERFADWLEGVAGERITEYAEIVGYHLEQAAGYRTSLGAGGERTANLRARAAERLLAAGIRAVDRSDRPTAVGLLERAVALLEESDERRARAQLELGEAYAELGEEERAAQLAAAVLAGANEPPAVKARAHILSVLAHRSSDPAFMNKLATVAAEALPDFQAAEDHEMIATAYQHLAWTANDAGEADVRAPLTMALEHAVASGRPGIINGIRGAQLLYGSLVGDGRAYIPGCLAVINDPGAPFELRGSALDTVGPIEAAAGDLGAGRAHLAQAVALFDEIQSPAGRSASRVDAGWIELWAGDPVAAERWFREAVPLADEHTKPYARARLGLALVDQDRLADAHEIADELELARGTDWLDDLMTSRVQAGIRQHEGHAEEAMALLRTAVDALPQAITFSRAEALLQLSQCAAAAHAVPEAIESAREAHRLFSERGATYLADAAARLLDGLGASADG